MFKKKGGKKYFGVPLDPNSGEVPKLVIEAIDYLEDHLNESGLFRISSQMNIITEIKNKWDKGAHESFSKQPIPHNVTGVLKLYLKEMPEPLLTFSRYEAFLHLGGEKDLSKRLTETKKLLESLPKTNYATIKVLLRLLNKIAACSATNNMRAANLSMVFAPNVFRPEVETIEYIVTDTPLTNAEFEFMIENYPSLFNDQSGKLLSSSQQPQQAQQQPSANLSESSSTNKGNDAHPGQSDPLQMMSGDFNIEELANLGGDMLQPSLGSDLGLAPQPPASDVTDGNNELQQPQADEMNHNDPVWNFRAQSYVVIENIYDITNIISENIPGIRCISELVYITTLLLETFEGTQCPIEEKLAESKTAPLQHVKDADETRLLPLLNICGDLLTQVADEIGSYVESLAEKMSFIEEMEPLKPIDERFRWIENTLVRANDAFEEPGAYVPDDPNAVSDVVVDASVIREIPGIPDDIDNTINLEGYVEESGEVAVDIPPPSQPEQQQQQQKVEVHVKAPEVQMDIPPPQPQKAEVQTKVPEVQMDIPPPQPQKVEVHAKAPEVQLDIPPPQPKVSAPVAPPTAAASQPQAASQEQNKITVKTQIKIQSNVAVNKQQDNTPAIATAIVASKAAPVNKQAPAAQNPTPTTVKTAVTVGEKTQPTVAAATTTTATVTAKTQQKSVADAVAGMVNAKTAQGGAVTPSTQKVAQVQVKKSEKPKTEGQRLDGSMLADPTGKIIEVLQLIQNDLRTINPQEARTLCTLISNIKIMIEHPNDDPGKIALITASTNVPAGVGIIGYTNTILIDTIHLLQELKERCVAKMHSADAITTANLLKAITKAIIERDKAELESLEG